MSNILNIPELDCVFLSYDEPNAEYNYADLLTKAPWAKRVHGVKGSDAAHKACADISETEHFITVDGDNIVDPEFFNLQIDLSTLSTGAESQVSWSARNHVNGLMYGNGGLKCWTRQHVWNMKTHEAAEDDTNQVDFCWNNRYHHMHGCYSVVYNNASPLQAFRAGFREGVKMSLLSGIKLNDDGRRDLQRSLPAQNYQRLLVWCNIGQDVKHGEWATYGARLGCYMTNLTEWDYVQVRDFEYLNQLFQEQDLARNTELGTTLSTKLGLPITNFNAEQSNFFKLTYNNLPRSARVPDFASSYVTHIRPHDAYDVVFIANGEPNAEENYTRLKKQIPAGNRLHRIDNVKGILQAHVAASKLVSTEMFYVVDADAWIVDTFEFDDKPIDTKLTYVYYSLNPVNDLCYGYGGVKLFPKAAFDTIPDHYVDMTTTVGKVQVLPAISCVTKFNTTAFDTWRSAFRECAKLSSRIIEDQQDEETQYRLELWTRRASGDHALECLKGATAGKEYGLQHKDDPAAMQHINDYQFLKELFDIQ